MQQLSEVPCGSTEDYEIQNKLGRKDFFSAYSISRKEECVLEILNSVRKKLEREIRILNKIREGPNIIKLLEIVVNPYTNITSLVFEEFKFIDLHSLFKSLSYLEIQFHFHKIAIALNYIHSIGIMHRALNPRFIYIDRHEKKLLVGGWEHAEFYHPNTEYNTRLRSRYCKSPEILLGIKKHNYAVDMWNYGCILAGILFQKEPFFTGYDQIDQIIKISKVLGSEDLQLYLEEIDIQLEVEIIKYPKRDWREFATPENKEFLSVEAIDLVDRLLKYNPKERISIKEMLNHKFFSDLKL